MLTWATARGPALLLLVSFLPAPSVQAQAASWEVLVGSPLRTQGNGRHEDLDFVSPSTGWIVNLDGEIHRTTDGGETWVRQAALRSSAGSPVLLRSVGFADERTGWAGSLTVPNVLYETRDGGQTWTDVSDRITGATVNGICGMWVVDERVAYAVGRFNGPARFLRTTDGGASWEALDMSAHASTLVDVYFTDEHHGFVVGGNNANLLQAQAVVLETTDGGATWVTRYTSDVVGGWGWKISFPTPSAGYVSVERFVDAYVLKTTDGGATWTESRVSSSRPLQGIGFISPDVGWVSGRGTTFETTNGGFTWSPLSLDGRINRFQILGDSLAYAVGRRVYRYRASQATARSRVPLPGEDVVLQGTYPNPFATTTTIRYHLPTPSPVTVEVYDVLGRRVALLVDAYQESGSHEVRWDGTGPFGEPVPPGVYVCRLRAGTTVTARTLLRHVP